MKVTSTADRNQDGDKLHVGRAVEGHEPVQLIHSVAVNKNAWETVHGKNWNVEVPPLQK